MDYIAIARQFDIEGDIISAEPFGNGLINSTILVTTNVRKYILQAINTSVFKNPVKLTENVVNVTGYLRDYILREGGDAERGTLTPVKAKNGGFLIENWRMYNFIEGCVCLERVENQEQFYKTGKAFGHFQYMLRDFPAHTLFEVIPHFHDTHHRFADFEQAVE
ncbi:MAG: mucin desulfatase, partial [Clostridia bacterium]|nr:mucin desulfatase [Clostridia bacterium]